MLTEIFNVVLRRGLKSGSLKVIENCIFDRSHTRSYWRSTVTMVLSCIVFEILNVE